MSKYRLNTVLTGKSVIRIKKGIVLVKNQMEF